MLALLKDGTFKSASQVAAYLGITPVEKTSGSSVRGRPICQRQGRRKYGLSCMLQR
ncbi:transposase [Pseudocitrobacter sp. MW920760]|nr:transposase [Pseudocitrobacter sp. MW920760]